ncbi:unnamed protein product [Ceutorhynchus assimilis]|uniref:Uncharacterized protein n=1 Tax=Ceutorhynchus assimilis TaxID=467358 RepID=A0A9P0DFX5_9CUCU|nr:unnamed protein product [Ceutorhynchus assimilis]
MTSIRLAVGGHQIEVQINNTKTICFDNINSDTFDAEHLEIRAALLQLHDQIKSRQVSINAAGCFKVNLQLLGTIYSTVTTLSVYAIEFLLFYSN